MSNDFTTQNTGPFVAYFDLAAPAMAIDFSAATFDMQLRRSASAGTIDLEFATSGKPGVMTFTPETGLLEARATLAQVSGLSGLYVYDVRYTLPAQDPEYLDGAEGSITFSQGVTR